MASIADVFFQALLDDKELQVQAQKSGDKAGETLGERMSSGISTKMRAGLAVISAGAAIATKGMVELDDVTQQFTADTGASADEANRARKAINEMAGRNLQPMREIGGALGKVHTDLGLVGDQAEDTTEDFLHFARVTKRDAAEEVAAFDDILDAYGETADKIPGIMDKLVVSHQEYGGAIADDEAALAAMAPQLKAFNLGIDDGIALLNLFKSSGLDAASVPKALNSAIQKLDGRPLKDFLEELSAIADPGKRAQRAIEIFGSKAGVQLANAIKPGVASLDTFRITTDEAAGATDDARDALDSTWGNRFQLLIKGATSKLIELGSAFGPVLTGVASVASIGGALGLDRFVGSFARKMLEAGKAGGEALIDGIGTTTGAAGTVVGNFFASRIENVLDPTRNTLLGRITRRTAAVTGALWGATFGVATKVAEVISSVLVKLPGAGAVRAAVLSSAISLGTLQGTTMGKAAGLAFKGGFVIGLAAIASDLENITSDLGKDLGEGLRPDFLEDIGQAWADWRANTDWPLGQRNAPDWASLGDDAEAGASGVAQSVADGMSDLSNFPGKVADDLGVGLAAGAPTVAAGAETGITDPIVQSVIDARHEAVAEAKPTPRAIADSLREGRFNVKDAGEALKEAFKNAISPTKEIAAIEGFLAGKRLAKAMNDKRPEVRAEAQAWKAAAEERLFALQNKVPQIALATGQEYADALASKKKESSSAAQQVALAAAARLRALRLYDEGRDAGQQFASGLRSTSNLTASAAAYLAKAASNYLEFGSPTKLGPFSEKGGPEGWGRIGALDWVKGWLVDPRPTIRSLAESAASALAVPFGGPRVPDVGGGLATAASVASAHATSGLATAAAAGERHYHLTVQGDLVAKDPPSVLTALRRLEAVAGA